jgi:predicted AAA+ superfamily ATPase
MNTILRTLLYEWKDRKLPIVTERDIKVAVESPEGFHHATVITGFRRVGKTYLMFGVIEQLLQSHSRAEVIYLNFEDERIMNPTVELLTDLIPEIQALYGSKPKYLFLDELQIIPNWSKWVRRILDTESLQLFVTGSTSKMSSNEIPTELRGRSWEINVKALSFLEFLRFKNQKIDLKKMSYSKDETAKFHFLFDEYLTYGGLPGVVLVSEEKKLELLQSYFQTVVQRDVTERYKIENHSALRILFKLLINSPYFTISKLHNTLKSMGIKVGKSTIDLYLSYIKSSYFFQELFIYNPIIGNQLQYPRKSYFVDTGFITALSTGFSKNYGRLFENVVFQKLFSSNDIVYYYKDDRDNKVDFAIMKEGGVTDLYQASFDLTDKETQKREIRSLVNAGKTLHCENLNIVTTDVPDTKNLPKEINVISFTKFL